MAKRKGGKGAGKSKSPSVRPEAEAPEPKATSEAKPEEAEEKAEEKGDPIVEPPPPGEKGKGEGPPHPVPAELTRKPHPPPPAWVKPFIKVDRWWTWFEERLLVVVILGLMVVMGAWVFLKGMQEPVQSQSKAGVVLRMIVGALVLGPAAWAITKRLAWDYRRRVIAGAVAAGFGAAVAPLWRAVGVEYTGHLFNWLQEGSSLTMFGQLRGVSTRLTVLLAMIGASLAAASGKHINIDAFLRFVPQRLRFVSFVASSLATAVVCIVAAWGFFEYIAINNFGAQREWEAGKKIEHVEHHVSQDLFMWRRQIGFDLSALPHVVGGGKWDEEGRLNGRAWNEHVESTGYREYFTKEQVDGILAPPDDLEGSRVPMVVVPDGSPRGLLVYTMNLTFPVGLVLLGLRFLLRLILVLGKQESLDPDVEFLSEEADEKNIPKKQAEPEEVG